MSMLSIGLDACCSPAPSAGSSSTAGTLARVDGGMLSHLHAKITYEKVPLNRRSTLPRSCAPTVGLQRRTTVEQTESVLRAIPALLCNAPYPREPAQGGTRYAIIPPLHGRRKSRDRHPDPREVAVSDHNRQRITDHTHQSAPSGQQPRKAHMSRGAAVLRADTHSRRRRREAEPHLTR